MSKIPHANRPGAFSNNDPDGDTFGKFLSDPMEEKPMTIRLQLFSREDDHEELRHTYDMHVHGEDDMDNEIAKALTKLLRHSWSIAPGDCIRINEV
jgi:hypothetical protein